MTYPGSASGSATEPLLDRLRRAVIGRYDVYAELGQGGMASVFLALDLALDRKVAIKVMSPALMDSADNIERFKREAKVAASLNHPHIINIFAVGDDPDLAFFVMKYVEGRSLDSVIKAEGALSVPFTQNVIGTAGKALHHAHTRGIIHRDVKPANFMLDLDGWLVVTDFGIAKQGEAKGLTMTGAIVGTPFYMSPEQFHGKAVTPAADQYALGIVAYEMLTGKLPYTGESIAELITGHLFDPVPRVRDARPDVPQEIDDCVARMMAKEPTERFPNLEEAVLAFGGMTPSVELQVRTQITKLAQVGAALQPKMNVPLSPVPPTRPPARQAPTAAPTITTAETQLAASVPPPRPSGAARESRQPWGALLGMLGAVVVAAGAVVWFVPSLHNAVLGGQGGDPPSATVAALGPGTASSPGVPAVDSTAIRDSMTRAAAADSIRRDSVARATARRAATTPTAPRTSGTATIRVATNSQGATLSINGGTAQPAAFLQPHAFTAPAGQVRVIVRAGKCTALDTAFTAVAGRTYDFGMRAPRC